MKKLLYLMIFAAPFGAKILSVDIGLFKLSPFRILFITVLLLVMVLSLTNKSRLYFVFNRNNSFSLKIHYVWLFVAFVSVLWSKDFTSWTRTMVIISIGVLIIMIFCNYLTDIQDICYAFAVLQAGIVIQAIIGWYEILTCNYLWLELNDQNIRVYINGIDRVPIAMQGNPNNFATLMLVGVVISAICVTISKIKVRKLINIVIGINYLSLLISTKSRANIVALIMLVATWLLLTKRRKWLIPLTIMLCFVLSPIIIAFFKKNLVFTSDVGSSERIRWNLILNGLLFLVNTIGIGIGTGQVEYWMSNFAVYNTNGITNMHNYWIEILTCYGLFFFIAYIVYYCRLFLSFKKNYNNSFASSKQKNVSLYLAAFMVGFIIGSISSSSILTFEWNWVVWAIIIAYQGIISAKYD